MMKTIAPFMCMMIAATLLKAQGQGRLQKLQFSLCIGGHPLVLDQQQFMPDGTPVAITELRFYVGHFMVYRHGAVLAKDMTYHLVDAADDASRSIGLNVPAGMKCDSIAFLLGVDSLTNVSGALGGDLDPTKGMYWAWNSGYINLKLEGSSPASPYPSHEFELHLGGYLPPHASVQRVVLPWTGGDELNIRVDVAPLLKAADLKARCNVMSPGDAAARLSRAAATMFRTHVER